MTEASERRSAKIYQFPAGGRAAMSLRRETTKATVADVTPVRAPMIAYGSSWYHEVAVQDAELATTR